jgi:hypothetical protein
MDDNIILVTDKIIITFDLGRGLGKWNVLYCEWTCDCASQENLDLYKRLEVGLILW